MGEISISNLKRKCNSITTEFELALNSPSLKLSQTDAEKLAAILNMLDPANLLDHTVHDFKTIRNYLDSPPFIGLAALALLVSLVVESAKSIVPDEKSLLEFQTTVTGLLDSMASRYPSKPLESPPKRQRLMLHRTLPKLDLFTSAGELSEGDLASLADLRDTDIIALVDPELSRIPAVPIPVPTLAQINPRPQLSEEDLIIPASTIPVENLYYSPFSSFAPSYDSTNSTVGYSRSVEIGLSQRRLKKWEQAYSIIDEPEPIPILNPFADQAESKPLPKTRSVLEPVELNQEDEALLESINLNPQEFTEILNSDRVRVDSALENNVEHLALLVRAQWSRLRGTNMSAGPKTVPRGGIEDETATTLRDTFTKLLSTYSVSTSSLLPPPAIISQQTDLIMSSLRKESNYLGTLDTINGKAILESALMVVPVPPAPSLDTNGMDYLPYLD